jgi:AAT family amino acid transporter
MSEHQEHEMQRSLEERHIQLMAIGGAIGVGLFLGSATAIKAAGPSLILMYLVCGFLLFLVMRALGEMAVENPISGSFSAYAYEYLGPLAGYLTGWSYWLMWVIVVMAETTAVAIYINYWWPSFPAWASALITIAILTMINLTAAKLFGELEFWFALIKVVTIIVMIVVGLIMIFTGLGNNGVALGFSNLTAHGGFFPNGFGGMFSAIIMVTFAFLGMELIGVTAGEAKDPEKNIAKAINNVFYRILIFYVGSLLVIMSIYPWNSIGTQGSPFVLTFSKLGIAAAAGIINFVVLTAAASSSNSGIYTTARMLHSLSLQGKAPKSLSTLSKNGVPARAIFFSVACMLIGVVLNYIAPGKAFSTLTSIVTFVGIFVWFIILLSHMAFRKRLTPDQVKALKFPTFMYPVSDYLALAYLAVVFLAMIINPGERISVYVGIPFILILTAMYYATGQHKKEAAKKEAAKK